MCITMCTLNSTRPQMPGPPDVAHTNSAQPSTQHTVRIAGHASPAPPQPDHAREVEPHRQHRDPEQQPVGAPRREPLRRRHRAGVGKPVSSRMRLGAGGASGTGGMERERNRGEAGRQAHDRDLGHGEPREGPTVTRVGGQPGRDGAPVEPAEDPEDDERQRLEGDDRAVRRGDCPERPEPDPRLLHPGHRHEGEAPEGDRRVPRHRRPEVGPQPATHRDEGDEAADPHDDPQQVHAQGVDRVLVARRPGGMPVSARMTTAASVRTASHAIGARRVVNAADTATTTATSALINSTRVVSRVHVKEMAGSAGRGSTMASRRARRR